MLTPDFLWHAADKVVEIWEKFNVWAILDICRRIMDAGGHMTASAEWQIYKMEQSGMARDDIMKAMRRVTKLSEEEVQRIFEEAAIESHGNDADIFAEAGAQTEPLNTKAARDAMQTFYEQTNGELSNFTRTTANAAQRIYIEACDNAFLKVRSGLMSQDQAIREAIEAAAADGLYVTYPSGHRDTVEVAVRRAVTTGVNRAALQLTIDECERQGTNYVIVSSHLGARVHDTNPIANHAGWQGQVYMIKPRQRGFWGALGKFADIIRHQNYPLLREATGYPDDPLGLGGYNCRHSMYPYIPGITKNHMTQYDSEENRKAYELSQEQRKREREIRRTKRELEGAKLCGDTEKARELQARLKRQQADYRDFCSQNGLRENFERTYTADIAKKGGEGKKNPELWRPSQNQVSRGSRSQYSDQRQLVAKTSAGNDSRDLSEEETRALNRYKSFDAYIINEKLRNRGYNSLGEDDRRFVDALDSALRKLPYFVGTVTRSLYFYHEEDITNFVSQLHIGKVIAFDQYLSTTSSSQLYNPDGQVHFIIENSASGRDYRSINPDEDEILYERGQRFMIITEEYVDDKLYVWLEEVG